MKYILWILNLEWYQIVIFQNIYYEEVKYKILEIIVWDYDRFKVNDFLGEVVIDLVGEVFVYVFFLFEILLFKKFLYFFYIILKLMIF